MKLRGLTDLCLILFLTSSSNGQMWGINVSRHINATLEAPVTILCTFTYPKQHHTSDVQVYWKKLGTRSSFNTNDKDRNLFVFHTNKTFVAEKYRGKTELIGDKATGNCSLRIVDIMDNERDIYVRIVAKDQNYSFYKNPVSISVSGVPIDPYQNVTSLPLFTSEATNTQTTVQTSLMYVAIFVPLLALLIIITVATAIFCGVKRKRSNSLTREESGYYANFSRPPSNQVPKEASCKNPENKTLSEPKVIDDPIYVNTEELTGYVDEGTDHAHNVYGNVDYSK